MRWKVRQGYHLSSGMELEAKFIATRLILSDEKNIKAIYASWHRLPLRILLDILQSA